MKDPSLPRRRRFTGLVLVIVCCAACPSGRAGDPADPPSVPTLVATARRAGLRVLEGNHLTLVTDRPPRDGDGVANLPVIFDAAFASWCGHYGIDPATCRDWRAFGCLIVDRERFRAAGLLPAAVPDFANGFCDRDRFWMADQSNADYRRHLLLHEGVHAFTLTLRGLATRPWYTEGIAEFLATHRLRPADDCGVDDGVFEPTPLPQRAADVKQLGRIETLRSLRAAGTAPTLREVFDTPAAAHHDLPSYAASWAAVTLLALHPAHAGAFAAAERAGLDGAFTARLTRSAGWDEARASRDFAAFTDDVDYGYDFGRSAVDWSPGTPLATARRIEVAADRGWQNSGASLPAGRRCAISARGRVTIGALPATTTAPAVTLESGADGISFRWYRGRPIGRLLAAQWAEPAEGGAGRFVIVGEGPEAACTPVTSGPLFLKINESPGDLGDNEGSLSVAIEPRP